MRYLVKDEEWLSGNEGKWGCEGALVRTDEISSRGWEAKNEGIIILSALDIHMVFLHIQMRGWSDTVFTVNGGDEESYRRVNINLYLGMRRDEVFSKGWGTALWEWRGKMRVRRCLGEEIYSRETYLAMRGLLCYVSWKWGEITICR